MVKTNNISDTCTNILQTTNQLRFIFKLNFLRLFDHRDSPNKTGVERKKTFTHTAAKTGLTVFEIFPLQKHYLENI